MADAIIDVARLREVLFYDPTSPSGLRWKVDRSHNAKAGDAVGCHWKDRLGVEYWKMFVFGKQYYVHRIVWMIERGGIPHDMQIDHVNGDGRDNRIENLRAVSAARNSRNQHRDTRNKTGVVGVAWLDKKNAYIAYFYDLNRKLIQRQFSCRTMTKRDAFRAAVAFRMDGIAKLNAMGAGYTRAHINKSRYAQIAKRTVAPRKTARETAAGIERPVELAQRQAHRSSARLRLQVAAGPGRAPGRTSALRHVSG